MDGLGILWSRELLAHLKSLGAVSCTADRTAGQPCFSADFRSCVCVCVCVVLGGGCVERGEKKVLAEEGNQAFP